MKHALLVLSAILICLQGFAKPLPEARPERQGMSSERLDRVTDVARRLVDADKLAGVVTLVARNGPVVHESTVGSRSAADSTPLRTDDLFRIYSMTKPITAAAAMQLYEQGRFHLNDPVEKFVPEFANLTVHNKDGEPMPAEKKMTMLHLLTHTGGLSYGFNPNDPVDQAYRAAKIWASRDLDHFAEIVAGIPLKFEPGSRWHYSVAVDVTGLVVQRISGQPFDEYLEEHIFAPLGMDDTFFAVPEAKRDRFLANHFWNRQASKLIPFAQSEPGVAMSDYYNVTLYSGGGGLVSTAMDYMKFAEAMRAGGAYNKQRILSPKTVNYMTRNHLPASVTSVGSGENPLAGQNERGFGFGLGFGLRTGAVTGGVIGSAGEFSWGGMAGTVFWVDPVEELVVVSMIQLLGSPWALRRDLHVAAYQSLLESYE